MKKIKIVYFVLVFIMLCGINPTISYGEVSETVSARKIVDEYDLIVDGEFENETTVTRFEALSCIMNAAGATEGVLGNSSYIPQGSYYGVPFKYFFFWDDRDTVTAEYNMEKYCTGEKNGYIPLACYNEIALGEWVGCHRYFFYDRPATIEETACFMMRIAHNGGGFESAKEMGVIKPTEPAYTNKDMQITPEYFCIMLERFLNLKRYSYFEENCEFPYTMQTDFNYYHDPSLLITYREYLDEIRAREAELEQKER